MKARCADRHLKPLGWKQGPLSPGTEMEPGGPAADGAAAAASLSAVFCAVCTCSLSALPFLSPCVPSNGLFFAQYAVRVTLAYVDITGSHRPLGAGSLFYAARGACQSVETCKPRTPLSPPWRTPHMCPIRLTRCVPCLPFFNDAILEVRLVQKTQPRLLKPSASSQRPPAACTTTSGIHTHEWTRIQRPRRYSCRHQRH